MPQKLNIGVHGFSGSGKSEVARYLVSRHGFFHVSSGEICRSVSRLLFGSEEKGVLNTISAKMREIDESIWIEAALRSTKQGPLIFDSLRYRSDAVFLRERGFQLWTIDCPPNICADRLRRRGQDFSFADFSHASEVELRLFPFDVRIDNSGESLARLYTQIDEAVGVRND